MRKHRLLACALVVAMALSMIPATALAAGSKTADATPDPISYDNGVTLGKTATGTGSTLAQNNKTTVTLSVEAPAENNPVIVEFVLDATESLQLYLDYAANATLPSLDPLTSFVTSMRDQLSNKNVYVGVTVFSTEAKTVLKPTLAETVSDKMISNLVSDTYTFAAERVGTNVQAGIRTGLGALQNSTITGADRYLVLVTDGGSFFYYDENDKLIGTYNDAGDNPDIISTDLLGLKNGDVAAKTNFEQAIVAAANEVDTIAGTGVNLITVGFPYYPEKPNLKNLTKLAAAFVHYAAERSVDQDKYVFSSSISDISDITNDLNAAISGIAGTVTTVIPAGAVVSDVVGEDFNFISVDTLKLTVDGEEYVAKKVDDTTVEFYANNGDQTPAYVVKYDAKTDSFTWTFNVPVLTGQKITLSYDLKLDGKRSTVPGKYVLPTNETAYLTPDPDAQTPEALPFPEPSLSYTVSKDDGGYTPPPLLNTEDHFAYIVGYPMDYYTGEKTDDQTKMPVKPQGQITRAEVATIFFRMLTDEARNEYWSQTSSYSDVSANNWFNNAVCTLSNAGIISGYPDGSFQPNGKITRAEFATIASRFFDVTVSGADAFPDISGHWARQYINEAAAIGIVTGYEDGTFRPQKLITRAEAMTMVNRTLGRAPEKDHLLDDMLKWPDNMDTTQWYYAQVQEATNSHEYQMATASDGTEYEIWTELLPVRDWVAFEKAWSDANSAANPGEVVR